LADQVADNAFKYAKYTDIRTAVVFGGVDMSAQTTLLRSGIELLIATPGRLLDHITQKTANLSQVQILILDEADRMLDMGFLPDLQRIIGMIPAQRQTLLFSATFSPEIKKLAQSYLRDPVTIEVARQNAAADTVQQIIHMVPSEKKKDAVVKVLNARIQKGLSRQAIVFTNSRIGCSKLASALERSGIKAGAIHGDKSQIERMQILESFKKGTMDVLVATDVAARGLDIADMPCVINHELPFNAEDYVHRIGRTGRAGAQGDAIALVDPSEERLLADIEKLMNRKLVRMPVPDPSGGVAADPFFYMPYRAKEESSVATNAANLSSDSAGAASVNANAKPSIKPTAKPVGALLGGFKKKS
jgi:superfamily II DNA/RNA helicase